MSRGRALSAVLLSALVVAAACGRGGDGTGGGGRSTTTTAAAAPGSGAPSTAADGGATTTLTAGPVVATTTSTTLDGKVELAATEVATGLDTVWALAWDGQGRLWFTEREGRVRRLGGPTIEIGGVVEQGESGLMGLEIDGDDNLYLMYTTADDNRVVRRRADGTGEVVLVDGIAKAAIHDGGRLRFGPDGALYASAGDASVPARAQEAGGRNGRVLALDPVAGNPTTFALGLRNTQGLCFAPDGRFLSTEHGPNEGDEVNVLTRGFNGRWPDVTGNGIRSWTPTIAPAGCAVYDAELIPQWKGSMLFVTLKERDLRRLTFDGAGRVTGEEILFDDAFGRLRDVRVGPDGAVYLATSNRDGRGSPSRSDDRILRVAPA